MRVETAGNYRYVSMGFVMEKKHSFFNINAGLKYYHMCFGAAFMHLSFLITFMVFELYMMVVINIVSVLLYVVLGICTLKKGISNHPIGWIIVIFSEIIVHAVIVTLIQGVEVFFFLYPPMSLPLYAYLLFVYCDKSTFIKSMVAFGAITFVVLSILIGVVETIGSVYSITNMHALAKNEIIVLRAENILFTLGMVLVFVLIFFLEVTRLVGDLQKSNEKLIYTATHDSLTGLSNRHSLWPFFEELEKSGESYCIIMGDLDDFKKINDTYGHDCGDLVLKSVANIIIENTQDNELACRWGGEEMLIVMRGSREECYQRISVIKTEISSLTLTSGGYPVKVTMTFGFADSAEETAAAARTVSEDIPEGSQTHHKGIESLISMVDKRLYVGKHRGKNVIVSAMD